MWQESTLQCGQIAAVQGGATGLFDSRVSISSYTAAFNPARGSGFRRDHLGYWKNDRTRDYEIVVLVRFNAFRDSTRRAAYALRKDLSPAGFLRVAGRYRSAQSGDCGTSEVSPKGI